MTVQGVPGATWLLRALIGLGGALLVGVLSASTAHAEPVSPSHAETVLAGVAAASHAAVAPAVAPVADVVTAVAEPVAGVVSAVAAPVTPVLPAAASDVAARAVASVTTPVAAAASGSTTPAPAQQALDAVSKAVGPVTKALGSVTKALASVTTVLDPVTRGLRPVAGVQVPAADLARGTDALDPTRTALTPADQPVPTSPGIVPAPVYPTPVAAAAVGPTVHTKDAPSGPKVAPVRAPHRAPHLPGDDGAGLLTSGSASSGGARGGVDGDLPSGVQPPPLRGLTARGSPCPAPLSAPDPEVPDFPA
ncbi:hypothetical protein [Cellulomonas sp.]|uniref:hypothetical protein n=1 Tax=Cellulomonas sp. TaxID=40001 RepID=UPI003BAB0132